MHQHSKALNFMPDLLLTLNTLLTSNVLVKVTIGIGDVIHKSKASLRDVSFGLISVLIVFTFCLSSHHIGSMNNPSNNFVVNIAITFFTSKRFKTKILSFCNYLIFQ